MPLADQINRELRACYKVCLCLFSVLTDLDDLECLFLLLHTTYPKAHVKAIHQIQQMHRLKMQHFT